MTVFPFDTKKLIEICHQNDIAMIGVFGSMARGKATEDSDIFRYSWVKCLKSIRFR